MGFVVVFLKPKNLHFRVFSVTKKCAILFIVTKATVPTYLLTVLAKDVKEKPRSLLSISIHRLFSNVH